jgi:crotonobetainyl-CoA:carnitine CoA-transferase CaiB-like acyl-CoA transferase
MEKVGNTTVPVSEIIPEFGPLSGIRVLSMGTIIASPYAAQIMGEFGAEVIHIERPGIGDMARAEGPIMKNGKKIRPWWAQNARNRLSLCMEANMKIAEAREIFLGLIKQSDIFIENLVWLDKLGISDEMLLETNPRIVIVHVSGFGHKEFGGDPEICNRPSLDIVGQAYSGFLSMQGNEGEPPVIAKPTPNDYITSSFALFGALAAYIEAQKTGQGQVVDVSQYEINAAWLHSYWVRYAETGFIPARSTKSPWQPYDAYLAKDNKYFAVGSFGPDIFKRCVEAIGADLEYFTWLDCSSSIEAVTSEKGQEFDRVFREYIAQHNSCELEEHFNKYKIPSSVVQTFADAYNNQHFWDRNNFIKYEDPGSGEEITAFGIVPQMSKTPGKVWRGGPVLGQDTEIILKTKLNYDDQKINELREKKIVF